MIRHAAVLRGRSKRHRHVDQESHHGQSVVEGIRELQLVKLFGPHQLAGTLKPSPIEHLEHDSIMSCRMPA